MKLYIKALEKLNYILRSVKIKDPRSKHNGSEKDILIENGIITAIKNKIKYNKHYVEVKIKNLNVCPGFRFTYKNWRARL